MSSTSTDALFQLIKTLEKSEKRHFKLFVKRHSDSSDLKSIVLFDAMDAMDEYDEAALLKKNKELKKQQLSNLKAHLYKQILASLRLVMEDSSLEIQLHEQLDYAHILYNKGLYLQSLKTLDKLKERARACSQITFVAKAISLEKMIEALHITRSFEDRASQLAREEEEVDERLAMVGKLSNLNLQLYSWFIKNGHARNETDELEVKVFFENNMPAEAATAMGFYEQLFYFQSCSWYAFIRQDFFAYYRWVQKWVDLFHGRREMIVMEEGYYIKALHNLLGIHHLLGNIPQFEKTLQELENFSRREDSSDNAKVHAFVYLNIAKINRHFLEGTFSEGLYLVPLIEKQLKDHVLQLDAHRILIFYYKIACLYFGAGNNEKAIQYLNKIINWKMDLRNDLQCYARLLSLIAHYELKHYDLLEYLLKSVYRFMAKMGNLSRAEEAIFNFLQTAFDINPGDKRKLQVEFMKLHDILKDRELSKYDTRAFMYLDIKSWLESRIQGISVQDVIRNNFVRRNEVRRTENIPA